MESKEIEENLPPQFRNIKQANQVEAERLPEEIFEEILARLPVKSLLKFRCVSKSWRSLIGSQKFIKTHLENSTKNTNFTHHRIILNSFPPQSILKHCSLHSLLNERITDSFDFDDPMFTSAASIRVVGCSDGLVCILIDRRQFFLWNPSTRVSKKLPDFDRIVKYGHITKYGFGFVVVDDDDGDYKVFAFLSMFLLSGEYVGLRKVYSLKTDSWKIVEDKDGSPFDEAGKFASGKLHWLRKFGLISDWSIVWFDLKSNIYGTLELPNFDEGAHCLSLGVIDGCLCLRDYRKTSLDVWFLKEYGVKESWYKVVTVPYLWGSCQCAFFNPLYIGPNREILFIYESTAVIYYPKDNSFLHPQILNFDEFHETNVYVESLVSPFLDGEEQENQEIRV